MLECCERKILRSVMGNEGKNKMIKDHPHKDRKYNVVAYNPAWPRQFDLYATKIKNIFGDVQIEHIGSTSVPDMVGKSCIDILVVVGNLRVVEDHINEVVKAGFEYAGQFVMEGSRLFRIIKDNELLVNIHFFQNGHPHIKEMLCLRNYLRTHSEEVKKYSKTKAELWRKYPNDYGLYRKYKDEYMDKLKRRVKEYPCDQINK